MILQNATEIVCIDRVTGSVLITPYFNHNHNLWQSAGQTYQCTKMQLDYMNAGVNTCRPVCKF